jgi:hypothetical protein
VDRDPRVVRLQGALDRYRGMRTLFDDAISGAEGRRFSNPHRVARREALLRAAARRTGKGSSQLSDDEAKTLDPWHCFWCAYLRLTRPVLYHGVVFWGDAVAATKHALDALREEVEAELVCAAVAILGTVDTVAALRPMPEEKGPSRYAGAVDRIVMAVLDEAGTVPEYKIPLLAAVGVRCGRRRPRGAVRVAMAIPTKVRLVRATGSASGSVGPSGRVWQTFVTRLVRSRWRWCWLQVGRLVLAE